MAIMDSRLVFGESFDLDQETGTYLMTNQIDATNVRDLGNGQPVYFCVNVVEAFTDGGDAATLTIRLCSDDSASVHASTSSVHFQSAALLKAALAIGKKFVWVLPIEGVAYEQFLGVNCDVGTAGFDTGMIDAYLTTDPSVWKAYADGAN